MKGKVEKIIIFLGLQVLFIISAIASVISFIADLDRGRKKNGGEAGALIFLIGFLLISLAIFMIRILGIVGKNFCWAVLISSSLIIVVLALITIIKVKKNKARSA
ncbi:hypothetical protein M1513_00940 [Patescibacteria group bacterium]|nr:hypothetical protein [Patescibacteria group bacterium]